MVPAPSLGASISPGNLPRWSSPQFCSYTEAQSLDEGDDRTKGVAGVSEPQRTVRESYPDLVERVVTAKAGERFDPSTWRTDLFDSDQEPDDFPRRHLRVEKGGPSRVAGAS